MKVLATLSLIFLTKAFAQDIQVGYKANYVGQAEIMHEVYNINSSSELKSYDPTTQSFLEVRTTDYNDGEAPQVKEKWIAASTILPPSYFDYLLKHCHEVPGILEVVTVKAGTFKTCKFLDPSGGFMNLGQVPFGIVKMYMPGEETLELESFTWK